MKNLSVNPLPWLAGTTIALCGVVLARLGPEWIDGHSRLVVFAGRLVAVVGLGVIMLGVRKRIQREETSSPES